MNTAEAIAFLEQHQPMPRDADVSKELMQNYDEVRKFFLDHADNKCIPLFLNSFGDRSGFGVYQLVEDVIKKYDADEVVPHLIKALSSKHESVRYWSAQIAAGFPDSALITALGVLLEEKNSDMRCASITALEQIGGERVATMLKQALRKENDEEVRNILVDAISRSVNKER